MGGEEGENGRVRFVLVRKTAVRRRCMEDNAKQQGQIHLGKSGRQRSSSQKVHGKVGGTGRAVRGALKVKDRTERHLYLAREGKDRNNTRGVNLEVPTQRREIAGA